MIGKTRQITGAVSTVSLPTLRYLEPEYIYMAVTNARCAEAEINVKVGDKVKIGQTLGIRTVSYTHLTLPTKLEV